MLTKLMDLHAEIFGALSELESLTGEPTPDAVLLAQVRWNLTRASTSRTQFLENEIYPLLIRTLPADDAAAVQKLCGDGLRLQAVSITHIALWPIAKILANWPRYCNSSRSMRATMRRRMTTEKDILYPLLARLREADRDAARTLHRGKHAGAA